MNLKKVLMELGNRLVTERHFDPAMFGLTAGRVPSTKPIDDFVRWLNATPDARDILAEMDIEWPVISRTKSSE